MSSTETPFQTSPWHFNGSSYLNILMESRHDLSIFHGIQKENTALNNLAEEEKMLGVLLRWMQGNLLLVEELCIESAELKS
jgi:hypothetical protein